MLGVGRGEAGDEHEDLVIAWLWSERAGVISHLSALALQGLSDALPALPTTNPRRSLNDGAREGLSPDLLRHAAQQALRRGLVTPAELGDVVRALRPFGGLAA